jgi:hypothetical protein
MATLAGVHRPFAKAQRLLEELVGWRIDDETIRRLTHEAARQAQTQRPERDDAERFAQAEGIVEVAIDAGKVNTPEGWRDVKVAVVCKRELGDPALPHEWDERELPSPTIRIVACAVEDSDSFAQRLRADLDRLGATTVDSATVLGDGAEWIWNLASEVLPQAAGVLDVYHAIEHVSDAAKAIWGDGTETTRVQTDAGRDALLSSGKIGIETWIGCSFAELPIGKTADPLLALAAYLSKHPNRMGYAERLKEGRSIGSGVVEGTIKQLLNLRLKRTGARWRPEHVGPLVELIALSDTPDWTPLWNAA